MIIIIIKGHLIENVKDVFIPEYVLLQKTERMLIRTSARMSLRGESVSPPPKAKEKKTSVKQHCFSYLFPPALCKQSVKVICFGLGRLAGKPMHSFFCRAYLQVCSLKPDEFSG